MDGGQVEIFTNTRADGDPGDMTAARVIGPVGAAGTAVIGRDDDECVVFQFQLIKHRQYFPEFRVGHFDCCQLFR